MPHAAEQLSQWVTTTAPVLYSLRAQPLRPRATTSEACALKPVFHKKPPQWEASGHNEGQPLLTTTRQSLHTVMKTQHSQTQINKITL